MKNISTGVLFLFGILNINGQEMKTLWQKELLSSTQDFLTAMTATVDRQILLSGSSINQKSQQIATDIQKQNRGYDYHVVKLDQQGNKIWDRYFGGTRHDYLISSIATQEGGFLLAGTSFSNESGDKKDNNLGGSDVWMVRLDENGEELWQKTLGTKSNDEASSVVQTIDLGFFVAGNINSHQELFGSKDVFISKLSQKGEVTNTVILGGKGLDEVQEVIPAKDGGAVVLMYSKSGRTENINPPNKMENEKPQEFADKRNKQDQQNNPNQSIDILSFSNSSLNKKNDNTIIQYHAKSEDGFGEGDYWIVKLNKEGKMEWQKTYGGKEDDRPKTIAFTEIGYVIAGESRSSASGNKRENIKEGTDIWVITIDEDGNEIWQKNYSFGNRDVVMSLDVIRRTGKNNMSEDKGFLIGGFTQAEEKIQTDDEKFWMLYIDSKGKEEWRKHVEGKSNKKEERLVSAKLQSDGTYLLAGTSAEELGQENWKIIKLGSKELENLIEKQDIRIYPNPVEDYCYVEIGFELKGEAEITIHDMSGRQIQITKTKNRVTKISTASLPQGIYVLSAKTENKVLSTKILKK